MVWILVDDAGILDASWHKRALNKRQLALFSCGNLRAILPFSFFSLFKPELFRNA